MKRDEVYDMPVREFGESLGHAVSIGGFLAGNGLNLTDNKAKADHEYREFKKLRNNG